jgi:small subunit ribosomal protein S11
MPDEDKKPLDVAKMLEETDAPAADAAATGPVRRKKVKRAVSKARVCVHAGENNTIVTFTDLDGNVLGWSSAGSAGFKGTRKSTPYAAKVAAETAAGKVKPYGIESVTVEVKGLGPGREQSLRGLQAAGLNIDAIVDTTPIAHGGCRAAGRRRV